MDWLLGTSVLVRLANISDPDYAVAAAAVQTLQGGGDTPRLTPQNMVEFHAVATRPTAANGLGLSVPEARRRAAIFAAAFPLLPDTPAIYPAWCAVIDAAGVIGKQVHDARLVAVCHVHSVPRLLTFNIAHFVRTGAVPPGVVVVHPASV